MPVRTGPGGPSQTWLNEGPTGPMPIEQIQSMVAKARDVDWVPPREIPKWGVGGGGLEASLFSTLNMISRGRTGGGTGGGSQTVEGGMDANKLISLNPFLSKNVTSFAQGGTLPSQYHDISALEELVHSTGGGRLDPQYRGGSKIAENKLIAGKKKSDFFYSNLEDMYLSDNYKRSFAQEKGRRAEANWNRELQGKWTKGGFDYDEYFKDKPGFTPMLTDEEWATSKSNPYNLKNPWEQGYDDWYTSETESPLVSGESSSSGRIDRSVLSRNTYDDGGVLPEYNQGGMYERAANQAIAQNQLSGLVANTMNRRMPMAAHGMKTPKYNKGGSTHTMPDGTVHPGATHEEYMAMMAGQYSPTDAPMANKGMRMKKRYTNGGRF